jgi:hypothetical protein
VTALYKRHAGPDPFKTGSPPMPARAWFKLAENKYGGIAYVSCVNGHVCLLSSRIHAVAADGTVSPSLVCPAKGCVGHEHVKLDGWGPGA